MSIRGIVLVVAKGEHPVDGLLLEHVEDRGWAIVAVGDPVRAPMVSVLAIVTIDHNRGAEHEMPEGVATVERDVKLEVEGEDRLILEGGRSVVLASVCEGKEQVGKDAYLDNFDVNDPDDLELRLVDLLQSDFVVRHLRRDNE